MELLGGGDGKLDTRENVNTRFFVREPPDLLELKSMLFKVSQLSRGTKRQRMEGKCIKFL